VKITQIVITGVEAPLGAGAAPDGNMQLRASFLISGTTRGAARNHTVGIGQNDLIELVFVDNTQWFCNADTLEDVFPEATQQSRSAGGAFAVPLSVRSAGTERGIIGDVALKAIHLFTKKSVGQEVRELAADLERRQLEGYSGLYRLDAGFALLPFTAEPSDKPYLLFLHGTASSTKGSFGDLLKSEAWPYIHRTYGSRVLAFQHETLTESPLKNVLDLVRQLPANASLHIISHSRGGLVGDILSRWNSSNEHNRGFDANEIKYLEKENRADDLKK
jgi:hypothetical protein